MRVFMLGWEFPPFISGGLGTACYGLTKALSQRGTDVTFVLPKMVGTDYDNSHVKLLTPQSPSAAPTHPGTHSAAYAGEDFSGGGEDSGGGRSPQDVASTMHLDPASFDPPMPPEGFEHVTFKAVPSRMPSPYATTAASVAADGGTAPGGISFVNPVTATAQAAASSEAPPQPWAGDEPRSTGVGTDYDGDLMAESQRYAALCVDLARGEDFDVIHAHDWLTFPAGLAVARHTGKPLVVHVHATEFDRAGENVHSQIYDIERRGMHAAVRVIAVSRRTRQVLVERYGVDPNKIDVVYNGVENGTRHPDLPESPAGIERGDKVVLFLGRVTMQKGPEYFLQAAKRVLEKTDAVKFVVAGSGDKLTDAIERVARYGIGSKVLFTGFLRGADVDRVMKMADVFVMPSVSEPFGIAPLEAISNNVPVIISKQSGVSEVLEHALKVDFWDIDELANKILAVITHAPLGATMREHAAVELRRLTWDGAASRCLDAYDQAIALMPA